MPRSGGRPNPSSSSFVDRLGKPITPARWAVLFDGYEGRILRRDTVRNYIVETAWHGTNLPEVNQLPFGTAVKCEHGRVIEEIIQYTTTEEAIVGHAEVVKLVENPATYDIGCLHDGNVWDLGEP